MSRADVALFRGEIVILYRTKSGTFVEGSEGFMGVARRLGASREFYPLGVL